MYPFSESNSQHLCNFFSWKTRQLYYWFKKWFFSSMADTFLIWQTSGLPSLLWKGPESSPTSYSHRYENELRSQQQVEQVEVLYSCVVNLNNLKCVIMFHRSLKRQTFMICSFFMPHLFISFPVFLRW